MRRRRLGLAVVVLLLLVVGAYTAFWFYVAGRLEGGVEQWAESMRAQHVEVSWRDVRVGGYPLAFRIELRDARIASTTQEPRGELWTPLLSGSAHPWNFRAWHLSAPDGVTAFTGLADAPIAKMAARAAKGSVVAFGERGVSLWLDLSEPSVTAGTQIAAREAALWATLPEHPPQGHTEAVGQGGVLLRDLNVPTVPAPLRNPIDEIGMGLTVMGAIPPGAPRQAAQAWRDAGGTLEVDYMTVRWGSLGITGSGTAALDPELQPEAAFSGNIEGMDELLAALATAGRMRGGDAGLARMALSMLAKPGPNGRPRLAVPFTIQNGQMSLGPIKLGKAPRISWE